MPDANPYDQFDSNAPPPAATDTANPYDQFDTPAPHKFGWRDIWPVRVVEGVGKSLWSGFTLPHDVYAGKVDPLSPEATRRSIDMATFFNEPGIQVGRSIYGAAKPAGDLPLNVQAAQAAQGAGQSLPGGLVSPNPIMRATTRAAESLPLVGPGITEQIGKSVEAAGEQVGDISSALRQGATSRADVGEAARPGLEQAIDNNNAAMREEYKDVKSKFDTDKPFELPETETVYNNILKSRGKLANPGQGLQDIAKLLQRPPAEDIGPTVLRGMQGLEDKPAQAGGATFDELQRVRSDFGGKINYGDNPGYNDGERKALYGAMSRDMENIAREGGGEDAVTALKAAHGNAQQYIEQNKNLRSLLNKSSNEGLAGTLIGTAAEKTGNIKLLGQLKEQMPPEAFQQISGQLLHELGHNPATNSFSLSQFGTNWSKLSQDAKEKLFDPGHRQTLDGLANMGKFLKNTDKYKNFSQTAHSVAWLDVLEHVGDAVGEAIGGNFKPALKTAAGIGMGAVFGKVLARPASASAVARWTRAAQSYGANPSIKNRVGINLATKSLIDNLRDFAPKTGQALSPQAAGPDSNNPPSQGNAPRLQVRIP